MKTIIRTAEQLKAFGERVLKAQFTQPVVVETKPYKSTRSLEQNAKIHPMLRDISQQVDWYGQKLSIEDWKRMMTAALKKLDVVPGIDGGFVMLGGYTSKMNVQEVSDMIEFMYAFGAEHNVVWTED